MNYKDKLALVWDTGIACEQATRLSRDFFKVIYYTPWQEQQKFLTKAYGQGFAPNIEKTMHFFDHVDQADLICFFDIGAGDMAKYLRKNGKRVFGGGDAEKLEEYRYKFRILQGKLGLPVQETVLVKGVTALRESIKKNPNKYVKIDIFRSDIQSFHAKDYESIELLVDEIETALGPAKEEFEFLIEEFINSKIEIGVDGFFNGNEWLFPTMWGVEQDKTSYIGKIVDKKTDLPKQLIETIDKLTPVLIKADYRGALSIEIRILADGKFFPTDPSIRFAFPLAALYTEYLENYSDVLWNIAEGKYINPKFSDKYLSCLRVETDHGKDHWVRLIFPDKLRSNLKLEYGCKVGKYYYSVKGSGIIGPFISKGNTSDQAIKSLKEMPKHLDCEGYNDNLKSLDNLQTTLKVMSEMGMKF